jgi:hypothetical protein
LAELKSMVAVLVTGLFVPGAQVPVAATLVASSTEVALAANWPQTPPTPPYVAL